MSIRLPHAHAYVAPQKTMADWVLSGLGLSAAAVSASFAAYMVLIGPGESALRGNSGFNVFVAFDRRPIQRIATNGPPPVTLPSPSQNGSDSAASEVDFTPTGSIAVRESRSGEVKPVRTSNVGGRPLTDFALRDVFDGKALIETSNKLRLVEPGSMLEGAGSVLAIRRGDKGWVVETSGGTIE